MYKNIVHANLRVNLIHAAEVATIASLLLLSFTRICSGMEIRRAIIYDDLACISFDKIIHGQAIIEAPSGMVPDSLILMPLKGGTLRSVSLEPSGGKAKEIKDALSREKSSLDLTRKEQDMLEKQIEIIYDSAGSKGKATSFDKSRVAEALEFIDSKVAGLNHRLVSLSGKAERLKARIKDLKEQLGSINKNPGYRIKIGAEGAIEISYALRDVSWLPRYRVLSSPNRNKLTIELAAQVRQTSGIDWYVRDLLLSTGKPSFGMQAPELQPWCLSTSPEKKRTKKIAATDKELVQKVQEATTPHIIGTARYIHVSGDGTISSIQVRKHLLDAELTRIAIPRNCPQVYLIAETVLKGDLPLLPGPYFSFVDGVFSGKGDLKCIEPGQKLKLDLGIDKGIRVERREIKSFEKSSTGKDKTIYAFTVDLENTRSTPASVVIKDQIPISKDQNILVELVRANPEVNPDGDGIFTWNMVLAPGKKEKAELSFVITDSYSQE